MDVVIKSKAKEVDFKFTFKDINTYFQLLPDSHCSNNSEHKNLPIVFDLPTHSHSRADNTDIL